MSHHKIVDPIAESVNDTSPSLSRRAAVLRTASLSALASGALRIASVPTGIALLARDAFGQASLPGPVVSVLNFALTLEYLEAEFYTIGVGTANLIPAADRQIFTTIRDHEQAHVAYLRSVLGASAVAKPTFDFSAGNGSRVGPYAGVFSDYEIFKAVAQAFEDTGVRAYKGQAPALQPYDAYLTAALTIHSVEARHAAEVRRLRGSFSETAPHEGWITRNLTDIPGTAAVYAGEENTTHVGINVASVTSVALDEVTEAFDEPLTQEQVLAIVDPFIV